MSIDRENRTIRFEGRVTYADAIELLEIRARLGKVACRIPLADADALLDFRGLITSGEMPGSIYGLSNICMDCGGIGKAFLYPSGTVSCGPILHDPGCPAAAGAVDWRPAE